MNPAAGGRGLCLGAADVLVCRGFATRWCPVAVARGRIRRTLA